MSKTLYTLAVDGYSPEITDLTFPLMRNYAQKIGAGFFVITTRKWPRWPAACEKFQVGQEADWRDADNGHHWSIFLDADALVHPDCFDITEHLPKDTVMHHALDRSTVRFDADDYFRRDGRFQSPGNWMTVASDWCAADLWDVATVRRINEPSSIPLSEIIRRIHPTVEECNAGINRAHLVDDYLMARNRARYDLKVTSFIELCAQLGLEPKYFWHQYTIPIDEKIARMKEVLKQWGIA